MVVMTYYPAWCMHAAESSEKDKRHYLKQLVASIVMHKTADGEVRVDYLTYEHLLSTEPLFWVGSEVLGMHAPAKTTYVILNESFLPIALEIEGEPKVDWVEWAEKNDSNDPSDSAGSPVVVSGEYKKEEG